MSEKLLVKGWSDDKEVLHGIAEMYPRTIFFRNQGGKIVEYTSNEIIVAVERDVEIR